ncbi:hypothetical protein SBA5_350002 [Candidatus Sulfotelmatomonas gaucii]|uniref:Uncharacterized protein n=1 Tax=Candidatus Sulfuritelmatomonas gaucii TaxID=2043161 RepID=A0A2N9LHV1_9BACT|nr:hypothetical protein SBA5_350002 [Candidatus Sulfotelmatomonas gaucii]
MRGKTLKFLRNEPNVLPNRLISLLLADAQSNVPYVPSPPAAPKYPDMRRFPWLKTEWLKILIPMAPSIPGS